MAVHPAIIEEMDMLRELFPGKTELTLDDYAAYFDIDRTYASKHFSRKNSSRFKIAHKRIGRKIIIPLIDFAYWLAQQKVVDGCALVLPSEEDLKLDMKRRRGFSNEPKYNYRRLG